MLHASPPALHFRPALNFGEGQVIMEASIDSGGFHFLHQVICTVVSMRCVNATRSEEHTSELQSHLNLVCRLLLEKKKETIQRTTRAHTARRVRYLCICYIC